MTSTGSGEGSSWDPSLFFWAPVDFGPVLLLHRHLGRASRFDAIRINSREARYR